MQRGQARARVFGLFPLLMPQQYYYYSWGTIKTRLPLGNAKHKVEITEAFSDVTDHKVCIQLKYVPNVPSLNLAVCDQQICGNLTHW